MKIERRMIVKLRGIPGPKMLVLHVTTQTNPHAHAAGHQETAAPSLANVFWFGEKLAPETTMLACDLLQVIDPMTDGLSEVERVYREIKDP
jgi:hypothetical protein